MKNLLLFISLISSCLVNSQIFQASSITKTLKTNDFTYTSSTDKIYALVSANDTDYPNSIAIINPYTNNVENSVALNAEPTSMAISDDGQFIYIGFRQLSSIKRFSTSTQSIDMEFDLGSDDNETDLYYTLIMDVAPNQNNLIAVVRCDIDGNKEGTVLFNSGQALPLTTGYNDFLVSHAQFIDQNTLYTYCTTCIPHKFRKYSVNSEGITLIEDAPQDQELPGGVWTMDLRFSYHNNKFYFNNGKIVDIIPSPHVNGQMGITQEGDILYDTYNNLICSAYHATWPYVDPSTGYSQPDWRVRVDRYSASNFNLNSSFYIQSDWDVDKIITCGNGCYALRTSVWTSNGLLKKFIIARDTPLSTNDNEILNEKIYLFPNPAENIIYIKTGNIHINNYKIYNVEGKLLSEGNEGTYIDITDLSQGLYLVKLTDENNNIYTEKIIKK